MELNKEALEKARKFATGRCRVSRGHAGPETGFAIRWLPKIAGEFVRPAGMPDEGYTTPELALAGAHSFKRACAACLSASLGKEE
jgi:hypothetical protein